MNYSNSHIGKYIMIQNLKALVRKIDNGHPRWLISLVFLSESQDCTTKYFITASSPCLLRKGSRLEIYERN